MKLFENYSPLYLSLQLVPHFCHREEETAMVFLLREHYGPQKTSCSVRLKSTTNGENQTNYAGEKNTPELRKKNPLLPHRKDTKNGNCEIITEYKSISKRLFRA